MEVRVVVDATKLSEALELAPKDLRTVLRRDVMLPLMAAHESAVKKGRFRKYRGKSFADRLQRRSGQLANAYKVFRPPAGGALNDLEAVAAIRSGLPGSAYARMQEFGGTVRAKKGKYLTIPTEAALTPAGVLKGRYRIYKSAGGYRTQAGETFLFKSKRGQLLIGLKQEKRRPSREFIGPGQGRALAKGRGKNRALVALYILRRSVDIPPRFGFFNSWDTLERGLLPKYMERAVARALAFRSAAEGLRGG